MLALPSLVDGPARAARPRPAPSVKMVPAKLSVDGRRLRYAVSDNDGDADALWAVNIHGYFAGGGMYWRESRHLADSLGWRVVNPCLPGFAGSDPLPWAQVSVGRLADQVLAILDHLGAGPAVLLGHSMGAAVAVALADAQPDRVLGVVYRDGAATPAWKVRRSLLVTALAPLAPDVAGVADLLAAVALDLPDLLVGRSLASTLRGLWPDARRNLWAASGALPVGSMLMDLDLSAELRRLARRRLPLLGVWGCFDRVANAAAAAEFSALSKEAVVWVPGGHSWMLPRPQGQVDVLRHLDPGRRFLDRVEARRRRLAPAAAAGSA